MHRMPIVFLIGIFATPLGLPIQSAQAQQTAITGAATEKAARSDDMEHVPISADRLLRHIPDPDLERSKINEAIETARKANDQAMLQYIERTLRRVDVIRRDHQVPLTLEDVVRLALDNNYSIQVERHNPAIETTRVVEAESAFDTLFFTNINKSIIDRPSGSQLTSTEMDFFEISTGLRKILPTGMQISGTYMLSRQKTSLSFQDINPEYFNSLELAFRQPLLRGFGIDYNRSFINISKNNRRLSDLAFRRQIRDTIKQVEEAYWRLVQARREIVISARTLADFERIYDWLVARKGFDVMEVQLQATKANLEQSRAEFIQTRAAVANAQHVLIAAMNYPELNLASDVEIIPVDFPSIAPLAIDNLAEVQTALDHRPEIAEQKLVIDNAKIGIGRAKNEELPLLDVSFSYKIDGLAGTADKSFDELSRNKFNEYGIGMNLEVPIGNRGPRAAHRRADLEFAREQARLQQLYEQVILDVNLACRAISTSYDQISPAYESANARQREVESIVARAERKDMNTLTNELNARQALGGARRGILSMLVEYNIAIIDLERAKGTLLTYNNIVIDLPTD